MFLFYRFGEILLLFPIRIFRILKHIRNCFYFFAAKKKSTYKYPKKIIPAFILWNLILLFLILDLFGIPEVYEIIIDFFKFNTRPLTKEEINMGRSVFKERINWERVRVDEKSLLGPKQKHFAYVSFYTVNSWGPMTSDTLIHELMHVWQFQHEGSGYIPKALYAQRTAARYNYGTVGDLESAVDLRRWFSAFNYEQQAEIVADYYRISQGNSPCWGRGTMADIAVYQSYIDQL